MSTPRGRRALTTAAAVVLAAGALAVVLHGQAASTSPRPDVCHNGCRYTRIVDAVHAARVGETIRIGPGSYSGGFTLDRSVTLVGAGSGRTTISGVGDTSVITIGVYGAPREPTVDLRGVTITGGRVDGSPESVSRVGRAGVLAAGGGIEIPPPAESAPGAKVRLSDVVVTGNRVFPSASSAVGPPCPGGQRCPYAEADGGGIDNWGDLTLDHSVVEDNTVGTAPGQPMIASDADGAGIMSQQGHLILEDTRVSGNTASASGPNARYADAGGVFVESGTMAFDHATITGNHVALTAALPVSVDLLAIAGGVHLGGSAPGSVVANSFISGNSVVMTNSVGAATAVSGGLHSDVDVLTVTDTTVSHNTVEATTVGGSTADAEADSGSGELSGSLARVRLIDNVVHSTSRVGNADAYAGASIFGGTATDSRVEGNQVRADAPQGAANADGGGFRAGGPLTLTGCILQHNRTRATGLTGFARGGAIFAILTSDGPPAGPIGLVHTRVTANSVLGEPPLAAAGGGIYTTSDYPLSLRASAVSGNTPDDLVQ